MITKLRSKLNSKTNSGYPKSSLLTLLFIIILYLGSMQSMFAGSTLEDYSDAPKLVKSYNITDGSTVDKSCFSTKGVGVIFQRADGCEGLHHIWSVHDQLVFNEYDNNTATIVGNVIDDQGKIGKVNIALYNKSNKGNTWEAACYVDGITDPRTLYQSFNGTITVGSQSFSVELKASEQHFIVADGAGFKPGQFGFGAWTSGSFGGCTEWFGNLDPIDLDCKLTVTAGEDVKTCDEEEVVLTAIASNEADCLTVTSKYKIVNSNTEAGCFTADPGFIFQKYDDCSGVEYTWGAGDDLYLREYDNNTGRITGTVIDQNGRVAPIDILLTDKEHSGNTWNASCYLDGISGPETFYRSFSGTITVDGVPVTVGTRFNAHFILAQGAGFDSNQYGIGAWTGGAFGECTEWFGNLVPQSTENENTSLSYLWSNGETTPSITVTESGDYTVTATDCKGCVATDLVKVTIGDAKADAGDDSTICSGEEVTLNVVGEGTYLWSTGATTASINVAPTADTTYTVTVTTTEGCEATDEVKVFVNEEVKANAGDDVAICADTEAVLTASGGGTYLWSTGETTASIAVKPTADTVYSVKVTSTEGCEATDEVKVTINDEVKADAGDDLVICADNEAILTATGGGSYLWSTGATTASIIVYPKETMTYSVTVTSADGCEATGSVMVTVNDAIKADAGDDLSICAGIETTLTAKGGDSYVWSTGETTASITVAPMVDTTYSVVVSSDEGCEATDEVVVLVKGAIDVDAGADVTICSGDTTELVATGGGSYLWSTGETTAAITVDPTADTAYTVTVTSDEGCEATDTVYVTVSEKVTIGDFVWLDENQNGIQDDSATGINDVTVSLFHCNGTEVATTVTATNTSGEAGAYSFEVCPNSGYYYIVFDNAPEVLEFTTINTGDDALDSDANDAGLTQCFKVENDDVVTIDAGLIEKCDIFVDAGENDEICEDEVVELTAEILDDTDDCPGGCVYPVKTQDRCYGPTGDFEVYLVSTGVVDNFKFKAEEQKFERLADGSARYTATATNGQDVIWVDAVFTGYTQIAPINSPKGNMCQSYDTADWEYWTTWSGTITSRDHGVFDLSVKGAAFQMGVGADQMRTGFGASGWFYVEGGDGFYTTGDINVALEECVEENVNYVWSTEDGNIVGSSNQKTIRVDQPGTYTVEATNCIDCVAVDSVTLVKGMCYLEVKQSTGPKMSTVYPMPVKAGGTLTIEFDVEETTTDSEELKSIPLKGSVDHIQRKEDVNIVLYNIVGQMISTPRMFTVEDGKATIYLDVDYIPAGKYILRAQGPTWSDAKNILVE